MPIPTLFDLRDFLSLLKRENNIVAIEAEVDAKEEAAEIHRRVISAGGPALLFKKIKGSPFPLVTNLFGSERRVDLAFGGRPVEVVEEAATLVRNEMPPSLKTLWKSRSLGLQLLKVGVKKRKTGPILETEDPSPDLENLPLLQLWPEDGGAFVTLGLVFTRSPNDGTPNLGIYRMQRYDKQKTGMHWQIGKGGGFHYWEACARNEPLPVSVFLGGPPALMLSALAPLPEGTPEILLTGLLMGKKLPVVNVPGCDHPIPARAEFALLGEVRPGERRPEGPFGDHYGYYSSVHDYPVFHCQRIFRRGDALCTATVVGKPCQEDFFLGNYLQRLLSPIFPLVMPSVIDLWSYGETGFHSLAAAVVKERYGREAIMSAFRILGEGQLSLTKFLLVTDTRLDLKDFKAVLEHILERVDWGNDLFIFSNVSMDTLDYAGPKVNEGSKGVLLGLGEAIRELHRSWEGDPPAGARDPMVFCPGCLVIGGPSHAEDPEFATRVSEDEKLSGWQLVVLCDRPRQAVSSVLNFLWTAFTRFEPGADLHSKKKTILRNHIAFEGPVVLDARMKTWYPKELFADPAISQKVKDRWNEYFPDGRVEMGSSDLAHLSPDHSE